MSVGDIEVKLGIKQPRLSRELAKLREEGMVKTRRQSKVVFYRLSTAPRVRTMVDAVSGVMLDKTYRARTHSSVQPRSNPPGGYGVFARTGS